VAIFRKNPRSRGSRETRLFFATDVHGSDVCFKKFINAGRFYGASHLIMGGDITGKSIVTIERTGNGWSTTFREHAYTCTTEAELASLVQAIRDSGQYPFVGERDEIDALVDDAYRAGVFTAAVVSGIQRWMEIAAERLNGSGIQCYVTPGNDDFWEIDAVIERSGVVQLVEGRRVHLDDRHEMITTGYSNPTPWHTEREVSENELEARLESMWREVEDPVNAIAVIHAPPVETALDEAPELTDDLAIRRGPGGLRMMHVGSSAVREWIERRQPLCGLHGHVHESKGSELLGRTLCLNPGSEYSEGVLAGAIVTLADGRVVSHQFISG
jgi:Icc-related predicted phosphoesterase